MRLEEKQGRRLEKGRRADDSDDADPRGGGTTNEPRNII
jgi:hypothetical protein